MNDRDPNARLTLDWDAAVACARTVLAWERTAVANLALAAIVVRAGIALRMLGLAIPITLLLVIAAASQWLLSRHIYTEHDRAVHHSVLLHGRANLAVAVVTLIAAVGSMGLAVAG